MLIELVSGNLTRSSRFQSNSVYSHALPSITFTLYPLNTICYQSIIAIIEPFMRFLIFMLSFALDPSPLSNPLLITIISATRSFSHKFPRQQRSVFHSILKYLHTESRRGFIKCLCNLKCKWKERILIESDA